MHKQILVIALFLLNANTVVFAQTDVLLQPIDEKTLVQCIQSTPSTSSAHGDFLARAEASGLIAVAYDQYTRLWQKSPQNAYANMRRGEAADDYWHYATRPGRQGRISLLAPLSQQLQQVAKSCLAFAQNKAPSSVAANIAYGSYLFWDASQMTEGLKLLKKAVTLDPKSAAAHASLGYAYSEYSGNVYNPELAEKEFKIAVVLDPSNAFSHWKLLRMYLDAHRFQDAQRELDAYARLIPASSPLTNSLKDFQDKINAGLQNVGRLSHDAGGLHN